MLGENLTLQPVLFCLHMPFLLMLDIPYSRYFSGGGGGGGGGKIFVDPRICSGSW